MLIPGANLLGMALRVINPQGVAWQHFTGRVRNAGGSYVNTYAAVVNITGSFQPISRERYGLLGLDLAKNYGVLFTLAAVQALKRDGAGDLVTYNGKLYQIESEQDWTGQDGWASFTCVEVVTQ